jgi:predicted O-methyltransferase YrrM
MGRTGLWDSWGRWPRWHGESTFTTKRFRFRATLTPFEGKTAENTIIILKHRPFIEIYREVLRGMKVKRILEIGVFEGGMLLFLADVVGPKKIVGIDRNPPSQTLLRAIDNAGLSSSVRVHGGVHQDNAVAIREVLAEEFGDNPLDLIIDDASHEYERTRAAFEICFGFLRPGGKYVIEDWGWLHWPEPPWQAADRVAGKRALTNLIFELTMIVGTNPTLVSRVDVISESCVVVTRGPALAHGQRLEIDRSYLTTDRTFVRI